ncbi:MAG TPA: FadR/GntR family transcriptional regulator [Acidimicrobiales bacterium]
MPESNDLQPEESGGLLVERTVVRQPLGELVAAQLLEEIVRGAITPGDLLPTEKELAERAGVSRLTLREATGILRQKGVIEIRRGQGTYVRPKSDWSPLDPLILGAHAGGRADQLSSMENLIEARRVVEVGVAQLAARRRTNTDINRMRKSLAQMREAGSNVDQFVEGDLAFHAALLQAVGNPVVAALFAPIGELLEKDRRSTSQLAADRSMAVRAHQSILDAVIEGDAEAARDAMADHLLQTEAGMRRARRRGDEGPRRGARGR